MRVGKYFLNAKTPRSWTPYLILVYAVFISVLSAYYISNTTYKNNQLRFSNQIAQFEDTIDDKISTYTALLLGGRGLFAVEFDITQQDFQDYVSSLELESRYAGMERIGVVKRFNRSDISTVNEQYGISVFPEPVSPEIFPVVYLEPRDERSQSTLGYDVSSEAQRKVAMETARDTGSPIATDKIELVQRVDNTKRSGFIIFVPIYYSQRVPDTIEARRNELIGYIYSPIVTTEFVSAVFGTSNTSNMDFSIYSGTTPDPAHLLFQTARDATHSQSTFSTTRQIMVAGQPWTIQYNSTAQFEAYLEKYLGEFVFVIGILISFILFALSRSQYQARSAVERSAVRVIQSEQALQEINKKMAKVLESITDGFLTINKSWECTYVNTEASRLFRITNKQAVGKNVWQLLPDLENNSIGVFLKKAMKQHQPSGIEILYSTKQIWLSIRAYPSQEGLTIYIQDITKRKNLERQKDEFIGIASHELKTPVTSVKAYAQVLYKRFMREGNVHAALLLQKMDNQIDKLTSLISDLLDATKIESGKLKLVKEDFSIDTLVAEVVEETQRTTDRHVLKIIGTADCSIHADRDRISQILVNLLSNAIKYSPQAETVEIEVTNQTNAVSIAVRDFGVGIPKKLQKNIFKRFFRVEGSKELTFPGLGLGLYITSEIIKRHNGTITVESEVQQGSTFRFTLPCAKTKSTV